MIGALLTFLMASDCPTSTAMSDVCPNHSPHPIAGLSDFLYCLLNDLSASQTASDRVSRLHQNCRKRHSKRRSISDTASFK
jgi:hypothetical protein